MKFDTPYDYIYFFGEYYSIPTLSRTSSKEKQRICSAYLREVHGIKITPKSEQLVEIFRNDIDGFKRFVSNYFGKEIPCEKKPFTFQGVKKALAMAYVNPSAKRKEIRNYKCSVCHKWHLTSKYNWIK